MTTTNATSARVPMKTPEVKAALRGRYAAPEWALMFEVGDGTGMNQRRWADAVAMNLWPSRGLAIHGFEIKVSRGDWLRELKNPAKSGSVQQYCDNWWIVAPAGMIQPTELPPTWGLLEVKAGGQIRQAVDAPKLTPVEAGRPFLAAMLRRASGEDEAVVKAAVEAEIRRLREGDQQRIDREVEMRSRRATEVQARVEAIEKLAGVDLARHADTESIGQAIRLVLKTGAVGTFGQVAQLRSVAARLVMDIERALPPQEMQVAPEKCDGTICDH